MPIDYHIDYVEGRVEVTFSGELSGQEILEGLGRIFTDEHWVHDIPQVWDGSQVSELDVDFSEIMALRSLILKELYPDRMQWGRTAVIVGNRVVYLFVRMIQALFERKKTSRIFFDRNSALAWVHLPPAESEATLIDDE